MTRSHPELDLPTDAVRGGAPPDDDGATAVTLPDAAVAAAEADDRLAAVPPVAASVGGTAARGAIWTVLGFGAKLVFRFGFNLILTRLVAPQVFGVMALVNLLVLALHMFSDLGITQCAVRHRRGDDPDFLNTAWTLQAVRGLVLWGLTVLLAAPAAAFYEEPALTWLIPLVGLTAALDGFFSTSLLTLNRRMVRGSLVVLEVGSYVVTMAVTVAVIGYLANGRPEAVNDQAVQHNQMLTLAVGMVACGLAHTAGSYALLREHRHRLRYDPDAARDLLHFGGWIFLSTACTFLAAQADRLVIGKVESLAVLGVYQLASQLAALPAQLVTTLGAQLVFPLYSRLFHADGDERPAVANVHRTLGLLAGLLASGLIVAGPNLVETIYPGRYQGAGQFVRLLGAVGWFTMLQCSGEAVLLARGQTRWLAVRQVIKLLALPVLLTYGYRHYGLVGLVVGFGAAEVLRYFLIAVSVRRLGLPVLRDDLLLSLLMAGTVGLVEQAGSAVWGGQPSWVRLACESAAVTLIWAATAAALWRRGLVGLSMTERQVDKQTAA